MEMLAPLMNSAKEYYQDVIEGFGSAIAHASEHINIDVLQYLLKCLVTV